jgi:hypothetical protein
MVAERVGILPKLKNPPERLFRGGLLIWVTASFFSF